MIKRLFIISVFTGVAYLLNILVLKHLIGTVPVASIKAIGELDAFFNLIINVLASGLLMTAVRDIAIATDWRPPFLQAQKARITFAIVLSAAAFLGFVNPNYFFLVTAPVFALNGDYALYGRGQPVAASFLAFCRVLVPTVLIFLCSLYWQQGIVIVYSVSTVLIYLVTGFIISMMLKTPYWVSPAVKSTRLYINSISLGIVSLGYYFLGLGLIVLVTFFYSGPVVALAYVVLKFYVIFKGVLRIINQAFISEMTDDEVCNKVDYLATMAGLTFLVTTTVFTSTFITLFFGKNLAGYQAWPILLGICGFLISPLISFTTKALLEKKDISYAKLSLFAMGVAALLSIILSFEFNNINSILISLIAGELVSIAGLLIMLKKMTVFKERIIFTLKNLSFAIIPVAIRWGYGDNYYTFWTGIGIYGLCIAGFNHKRLRLPVAT